MSFVPGQLVGPVSSSHKGRSEASALSIPMPRFFFADFFANGSMRFSA